MYVQTIPSAAGTYLRYTSQHDALPTVEQSNQMKIKSCTARARRLNINYSLIQHRTELMIAKHGRRLSSIDG